MYVLLGRLLKCNVSKLFTCIHDHQEARPNLCLWRSYQSYLPVYTFTRKHDQTSVSGELIKAIYLYTRSPGSTTRLLSLESLSKLFTCIHIHQEARPNLCLWRAYQSYLPVYTFTRKHDQTSVSGELIIAIYLYTHSPGSTTRPLSLDSLSKLFTCIHIHQEVRPDLCLWRAYQSYLPV